MWNTPLAGILRPGRMANWACSSDAADSSCPCELGLLLFQALQLCPVDEHLKAPDAGAHKAGLGGPSHRADRQHCAHIDQCGGHQGGCGNLLHQLQRRGGAGWSGNPAPDVQVGCSGQATGSCRATAGGMHACTASCCPSSRQQTSCRAAVGIMHSHLVPGFSYGRYQTECSPMLQGCMPDSRLAHVFATNGHAGLLQ